MPIEWDKIEQKPNKSYKIEGQELIDLRDKLRSKKQNLTDLSNNNIELAAKLNSLEEEMEELKSKFDQKHSTEISLESKIEEKDEKISQLELKLDDLKTSHVQHEAEYWSLKEDLSDKDDEISELQNQNRRLQSDIAQLTNQLSENQLDFKNLMKKNESIIKDLKHELETLQMITKTKEKQLIEKDAEIDLILSENKKLTMMMNEFKEQVNPIFENFKKIIEWSQSSEIEQAEAEVQRQREEELRRQQAEAEAQLQKTEIELQIIKDKEEDVDLSEIWKKVAQDTKPNTVTTIHQSSSEDDTTKEKISSLILVNGISEEIARALIRININTIMGLAMSDPLDLAEKSGLSSLVIDEIIKNAKDLLGLD